MVHLGGVFLASHDSKRLVQWFEDALGLEMQREGDGGMAMFPIGDSFALLSVQPAKGDAPAPPKGDVQPEPYGRQPMMLNLRVDDLDAALAKLKAHGDDVAGPTDYPGIGRFGWTRSPDGHDIELWQP